MTPPSPRRSSRARFGHSRQNSAVSGTNTRFDRSTRSINKNSPEKSTSRTSLSSEPPDDFDDTLLSRRRKRGADEENDRYLRHDQSDTGNASDMEEDEDEAVRCLCGSEDYPGRPKVDGAEAEFFNSIELTEDVTGFFVQCDICKVWQHGACVGIFSAESSPDEYFCEQCRNDLHRVYIANDGQKYSKYLPLHRSLEPDSRAESLTRDGQNSRNSRSEARELAAKRRSTMNSRDAAYDDEQLRRAIEASREELPEDGEDSSSRRPKRGRSDSESNNASSKRPRTNSPSPSPADESNAQSRDGSADEEADSIKRSRSHTTREKSERSDREQLRQEAAAKRQGRAERRRADESELSDDGTANADLSAAAQVDAEAEAAIDAPASADTSTPGTPPPNHDVVSSLQRKATKSSQRRARTRPQAFKDREGDRDESPATTTSRDLQQNDESVSTPNSKSPPEEQRQTSKAKSLASKLSLLDMKRRVAAIMDFISRTQVDLAAETDEQTSSTSSHRATPDSKSLNTVDSPAEGSDSGAVTSKKDFEQLNCLEMMDVLSRDMVRWQNQYS